MIYLITGVFLSFLSFIDIFYRNISNSKFNLWIALSILLFISSFRFEVGQDWINYLEFFEITSTADTLEYGYKLINNLFSNSGSSYNFFLFFISFFTLFFINNTLITLKYKVISVLIYFSDLFLYYNLSGMRQGIAIAITLFSLKYIIEKNLVKFLFIVFLASLFHISSIIFVLAYFAYSIKITRTKLLYLIFIGIVFFVNIQFFIDFLLSTINSKKLIFYLSLAEIQENNTVNFIIGLAKRSVVLIIFVLIPREMKNQYNLSSFVNIYILGFLIYAVFYTINEDIAVRLSSYFLIFDIIIFSIFFQLNIASCKKFILFCIIISMSMYELYGYSESIVYQYKTFL